MTQRNFEKALKKGEYGQNIVHGILEQWGYVVYGPYTGGAHAFDFLAIKDKTECIAVDVKTKPRRKHFPDTGVNISHYNTYKDFSEKHSMPFWLIFVDEDCGDVYGNTIERLDTPKRESGKTYPLRNKGIIYWPVSSMIHLENITDEDRSNIKAMSQRKACYQ